MPDPSPDEHAPDLDFERLLTFFDAVVAIAITLLSIPLIDLATQLHLGGSVGHLLSTHVAELYGFLLSFVVILRLWFGQHRLMRLVAHEDRTLTGLLVLWLVMVVLLPFPTGLLAKAPYEALTKVLYLGNMAVASGAIAAIAHRIAVTPSIRRSPDHLPDTLGPTLNTLWFLLSLAATLVFPAVEYWPLVALFLTEVLTHRLRGAGSRR